MQQNLISPYGGDLVNLVVDEERSQILREESHDIKSLDLSPRQVCDVELLMNGGFSPLTGFMTQQDYKSVCSDMRLTNGGGGPTRVVRRKMVGRDRLSHHVS
jgi:sulfate adenylyltransferase